MCQNRSLRNCLEHALPRFTSLLPTLIFTACRWVWAQEPAAPLALHYEVVSIHEAGPGPRTPVVEGDEHQSRILIENYGYASLIVKAFGVRFWQLEELPGSLDEHAAFTLHLSSGEDTDATLQGMSDAEAGEAHERMLQEVLAERFALKYHWVTEERPSLVLVAGRQPKLHASAVKPPAPGEKRTRKRDDPSSPWFEGGCGPDGCSVSLRGFPMSWIVNTVSVNLRAPVVDRTGLTGLWDFKLEYLPSMGGAPSPEENTYPLIEAAVVGQLGLRVERGKAPMKMLVIDHIEPPTFN